MGVKRYNGIGMVTEDEFNTGLAGKLDKPDAAGNENDVLTKTADGGEVWAPVSSTGTPADSAVSDSSTNAVQNKVIKKYVDDTADTKANKDGRYDLMVVGAALNLDAPITTEDAFLVRPTGGADVEAADGVAQITEVKGNSVKFNQLVDTNTTTVTVTSGHKYYARISGTASVATSTGAAISVTGGSDTVIDLTAAEIADLTTVEAVEAWLEANVGLRAYYPYTTGTVLNNCMEGIAAPGYNLLDPATGKAVIIGEYSDLYGNYYGIVGTHGTLTFTDVYGNTSTITPDSDGKFELTVPGELSVASAGADCAVFLWWDGTKKEYQPYELNESFLDVKHIYGKLNGAGDLVQVWADGMPKVNSLQQDVLHIVDGETVADRLLGDASLDELDWSEVSDGIYSTSSTSIKAKNAAVLSPSKYNWHETGAWSTYVNMDIGSATDSRIRLYDTSISSVEALLSSIQGIKLVYVLATPLRYTNLVYQGSSHFADGTPVVLPVTYKVNNWSIESIIPQNTSSAIVTAPPVLTCKYSLGAVDLLNTHTDEIADLYATKADTEGSYPGIISGNLVDVNGTGTDQEFVYRPTGGGESLAGNGNGVLQAIKGRTLVWNQLKQLGTPLSSSGITISENDDGTVTINGTASAAVNLMASPVGIVSGHKYLIRTRLLSGTFTASAVTGQLYGSGIINATTSSNSDAVIVTATGSGTAEARYHFNTGDTYTNAIIAFTVFDFTTIFGPGYEPATVAEFEALFHESYYAYNPGSLLPYKGTGLKTTGTNQWDEEWEDGDINANTGVDVTDTTRWRSGFIPLVAGNSYYYKAPESTVYARHFFYDVDKNFISAYSTSTYLNNNISTPSNAAYMRFVIVKSAYGSATYNHNICINLSDPAINGQYFPYVEPYTLSLPIVGKTAKDSDGNPIVPFPDGMHGTPTVYDVARKEGGSKVMTVVNMGNLSWGLSTDGVFFAVMPADYGRTINMVCSGYPVNGSKYTAGMVDKTLARNSFDYSQILVKDTSYATAEEFKAAMAGVKLVYELATPVPFTWDEPLEMIYPAPAGGTEAIIPQGVDESGVPATAPLKATIFYSKDYVQTINDMPKDFDTTASIDALASALATTLSTALNGTFTITRGAYDESGKKYGWTVSFTSDEEE